MLKYQQRDIRMNVKLRSEQIYLNSLTRRISAHENFYQSFII